MPSISNAREPPVYRITCDAGDEVCLSDRRMLAKEQLRELFSKRDTAEEARVDWAGHSSFFGMAPPKIQGTWSYEELLAKAGGGRVATVQIAVQHNQVVATTPEGHRYVCALKDEDFPILLTDAMRADGSLPFEVLPMDPIRAQVREAAIVVRNVCGALFIADELDLLPWDTTPYGSLKEREEAMEMRAMGESPPTRRKPVGAFLKRVYASVANGLQPDGAKGMLPVSTEADPDKDHAHDEMLRRVLGLTTWDAAEELKQTMKAKVLESEVHKGIVEGHNHMVADLKESLKETPWVTPVTLDPRVRLPTLEQLFSSTAWEVGRHGMVTQYISAHPPPETLATADSNSSPAVSRGQKPEVALDAVTGRALAKLINANDGRRYSKSIVGVSFECEHGLCRLCPEFSDLYGHRVYVCKQLATA